jgi:hypothetical protein
VQKYNLDRVVELSLRGENILLVKQHPDYPNYLLVDSPDPLYFHTFKDLIGPQRAVHLLKYDKLEKVAAANRYHVFATDLPKEMIDAYRRVDDPYPGTLNVSLFRFQNRAFNLLKHKYAHILDWSTGCGKAVMASAFAKYYLDNDLVDKVVIVAKGGNKIGWQRRFLAVTGLTATVIEAPGKDGDTKRERRAQMYKDEQIWVVNYEKFRWNNPDALIYGDGQFILKALKGKRVYFVWDEMPAKLSSTSTLHYAGIEKLFTKKGVKAAYQSMLSATAIETMPENVYACLKILDKKSPNPHFKNKDGFRREYARSFNHFVRWKVDAWDIEALHEMGMRLSDIVHKADKYRDADIRAEFPLEQWDDIWLELSDADREIYEWVLKKNTPDKLSQILSLQVICDCAAWLKYVDSPLAQEAYKRFMPSVEQSNKLKELRQILNTTGDKIVLFTMYDELGVQPLKPLLAQWDIPFVSFEGSGKKMQEAIDAFQNDPTVRVFLSSDKGSDSIELDASKTVVNFNLPWNYSRLLQRVNRVNRITSKKRHGFTKEQDMWVFYLNLLMSNTYEEEKKQIIEDKKELQEAIFDYPFLDIADKLASAPRHELISFLT